MSQTQYKLYHYWRSSSSWRVRIAMNYKALPFEAIPVNLLDGESESPAHLARNPAGFVPVLELTQNGKPVYLTESLAIIRYLEETHPTSPTLFPGSAIDHAHIWALAETINAGTQPIQNIPVMAKHSDDPKEQKLWGQHFIREGLKVFETLAKPRSGKFSYGDAFSLADVCLIPQIYNADRFEVKLDSFPKIQKVYEACKGLDAVVASHPDRYKPS